MLPPEEAKRTRTAARAKAWCLICFVVGLMLTNFPLVQIFNQPVSLMGIPLMVAYLLGIWLVGIVVLVILARTLAKYADKD